MDRIKALIVKHIRQQLAAGEEQELQAWINQTPGNKRFFEEELNEQALLVDLKAFVAAPPDEAAFRRTLTASFPEARLASIRPWRRYAAIAASVIIVVLAGAYLITRSHTAPPVVANNTSAQHTLDISPGHDGAVLTLADGSTVVLDSAATGVIARQGNTRLVLGNGKLSYDIQGKDNSLASADVFNNQLATPRGRKYHITLPDGTEVWLNAASSLRYPVQFTGKERKVEITGEAYFEVAQDAAKPFIVRATVPTAGGAHAVDITVLGTHFNVMAYKDEDAIRTTLLQGRVSVRFVPATTDLPAPDSRHPAKILAPGQQAIAALPVTLSLSKGAREGLTVVNDIDMDQVIAWKNNLLSFSHADLRTLMRQVARWYDVAVVYEGDLPERTFSGKFPSNVQLSGLLTILDASAIHYSLNGKTLTIKP